METRGKPRDIPANNPEWAGTKCPNCQGRDPTPPLSDNGTTTCPRCGHRFPVDEWMYQKPS
jgi:uncharacterized paraquat-inducible protein A